MLSELRIENLGIIAELNLLVGSGMTALTGETGAGKTMLVEAISLLVGGRGESSLVRPGCSEASVEGRFVVGDDEIILGRVIPAVGRTRSYVNGRLATAASLAEEGTRLVDLHGQHAHQSLLAMASQRGALDRFSGVDLTPLRRARADIGEIDEALSSLGGDTRARAREIDLLRYQVEELAAAAIGDPEEDESLDREEDLLAGVLAHREAAEHALAALSSDEGALDALGTALAALSGRGPFDGFAARLRSVSADVEDLASELRTAAESLEDDPARLTDIRARRQLLRDLRRKYGDTLAEVMAFETEAATRLAELTSYEERVAQLQRRRDDAVRVESEAAVVVGRARRAGAPKLAKAVMANLGSLAMAKARIEVVVDDQASDPSGENVSFLLGANAGEPVLPLAKVASGGELARTMLALRLVLTEAPDTLVFDEVDAGVGGTAALAVGAALARLGEQHQVLVVTHLPQVAAFADTQVAVTKSSTGHRTVASATVVDGDDRVRELSRMLSGMSESGSARRHAEELLAAAAERRGR